MLDEEKKEQRNMMIAMILVVAVLMLFNRLTAKSVTPDALPVSEPEIQASISEAPIVQVVADTKILEPVTVAIDSPSLSGNFQADGSTINQLNLKQYRQTTDSDSPAVTLLEKNYTAALNWSGDVFPDTTRPPKVDGSKLTPDTPITLTWNNGTVTIRRTIRLDNRYLMTFTDEIINQTNTPVQGKLIGQITRAESDIPTDRSTVHEGFLGLFDNKEKEERYTAISDDKPFMTDNQGGWIGMTDKYWQTIFVPDQQDVSHMKFEKARDNYISSFTMPTTVPAGQTITRTTKLFAGAKELDLINMYEKQGIPRFDLSIDFGWYYFLTKPFLYFLGWLYALVGNMGIAILVFATLIRILLLPIATKSYESMAKMKKIQPKIKDLQERFKDDKPRLQIEMMNLYKRDKVNPASGCLPMLIQIPVFFALYKVLSVSILMRQAPFFGWITDLSQPDPSSIFTAFGYLPWPIPRFLDIGVWAVLMGLTMVIQQRLNPTAVTNKDQKMMMNMMPVLFTFMMGNFAAGLVIYWTWSNILSIAQQKYIMKKFGA